MNAKTRGLFARLLGPFLILGLILPNPVYALRQTGLEESDNTKKDLIAALLPSNSPDAGADPFAAGLEETEARVDPPLTLEQRKAGLYIPPPMMKAKVISAAEPSITRLQAQMADAVNQLRGTGRSVDLTPIERLARKLYRGFPRVLPPVMTDERTYNAAFTALFTQVRLDLLPRFGQYGDLLTLGDKVVPFRWSMRGGWQAQPYLGLPDVLFIAEADSHYSGIGIEVSGYTTRNIAFVDRAKARANALKLYKDRANDLQQILPLTPSNEELVQRYLGEVKTLAEETAHARANAWAQLRPRPASKQAVQREDVAGSLLKAGPLQGHWLQRMTPQERQAFAGALVEMEGEVKGLVQAGEELLADGRDDAAFGAFLMYLLEKRSDAQKQRDSQVVVPQEVSSNYAWEIWMLHDYFSRWGYPNEQAMITALKGTAHPGRSATDLLRAFDSENFLSDAERETILRTAESPAAGLEERWQDQIQEAARQWQEAGWIRSAEAFAEPFLNSGRLLQRHLMKLELKASTPAVRNHRTLLKRRLEETMALAHLLGELSRNPSSARISQRRSRDKSDWVRLEIPYRNRKLFAALSFQKKPQAPRVGIELFYEEAPKTADYAGNFFRLGQIRIGADENSGAGTPLIHADLADSGGSPSWGRHLGLIAAFTDSKDTDSQLSAFRHFQDQLFSRVNQLPDISVPPQSPAAGLEERPFPPPILDFEKPPGLWDKLAHVSFLNRHRQEWQWLREHVLPSLVERAQKTGNLHLSVLVLGASTGEELARAFHEIAAWLEEKGYSVANNTSDHTRWQIEVNGLERARDLVMEGQARLRGESSFVWSRSSQNLAQDDQTYAESVAGTLNRYLPASRENMILAQGDFTDSRERQRFHPDLVILNAAVYLLSEDQQSRILEELDAAWPDAWLAMTPDVMRFKSRTRNHEIIPIASVLSHRPSVSNYYFGRPQSPAAGLEERAIRRLLIAENDPTIHDAIVNIAKNWGGPGLTVVGARSFGEAWERFSSEDTFDAAVLDVGLGDGDGVDLAGRMIRSGRKSPRITFFSGGGRDTPRAFARFEELQKRYPAQIVGWTQKPPPELRTPEGLKPPYEKLLGRLNQAVRDLPAAGLEEPAWMGRMRELLRPLYGDRVNQLTPGDLKMLRRAGTVEELQNILGALNVALGGRSEEGPVPVQEWLISGQIQSAGFLYRNPLIDFQWPGRTLQNYLQVMPPSVEEKMLALLNSGDLGKIGELQEAISGYLQTAKEDDEWALRLMAFVEPDLSDELREQIRKEGVEILSAVDSGRTPADVEGTVNSWMERIIAPNLDGMVRWVNAESKGPVDLERMQVLLVHGIVNRFLGVYFRYQLVGGLPWITLSRKRVPSDAAFLAKARHELMHQALWEMGLHDQRLLPHQLPTGVADWLTMIAELAFLNPKELDSEAELPPTILQWLKEKGRSLTAENTAAWLPQIRHFVGWMPRHWQPYAIGAVNAGVAEALAEEILPAGNESEKRRLALEFAGQFVRYGDGPMTLNDLGPAAQAFRASHGLPEEAAGLEEKGTPETGRAALVDFVARHQSTIDLLTQGRADAAKLADYFPEAKLQELAQSAGYKRGLVLSLPQAGLPSAFLERGIPVFVQEKYKSQVKANLQQAVDQGAIRFVDNNPAEAYLVIGEEKAIPFQPGQVFIGVNEQTASRVTPGLLEELQQQGLLEPGSVVMLYRAPKDSVLIFA